MEKVLGHVYLKSGAEFTFECEDLKVTVNARGKLTGYTFEEVTKNNPIYLDCDEVCAITWNYLQDDGGKN